MIRDFFLGLGTGLKGDLLVWLLLLLNALAGWAAYGLYYKATPEDIGEAAAELRVLWADLQAERARQQQ